MASVVSIYHAFADVVFESRLDAAKTLDQYICSAHCCVRTTTCAALGESRDHGRTKA